MANSSTNTCIPYLLVIFFMYVFAQKCAFTQKGEKEGKEKSVTRLELLLLEDMRKVNLLLGSHRHTHTSVKLTKDTVNTKMKGQIQKIASTFIYLTI